MGHPNLKNLTELLLPGSSGGKQDPASWWIAQASKWPPSAAGKCTKAITIMIAIITITSTIAAGKCSRAAGPAGQNCPAEERELCSCCPAGDFFPASEN